MEKELIICDTNIFISYLNNDEKTIEKLKGIGLDNVAMSAITAMELLQGMSNKNELRKMQKTIKQYNIIDFTNDVSELAVKLIEQFSLSNCLQIPDSIIGATAIVFDLPLFTYNTKDFKFMPNIRLLKL